MRDFLLILLLILAMKVYCQDPQFSQYYNAPLILNPAMTGNTDCYRAGFNARTQWFGLPGGAFNTASLFVDLNYPDLNSGFGLLFLRDVIGTPKMSANEVSGFYSFLAPVSKIINFKLGLQATYVSRSLDYSRLIFEDQLVGTTATNPSTLDPVSDHTNVNYADFSSGVILFGENRYWIGFSAHHLTRPEQSFYLEESRLPIKYSLHGGYNIYLSNKPNQDKEEMTRLIPTFIYKAQAKFDQVDFGVYLMKIPFMLGVWYRGIFIKQDENIINRDAINAQLGFQYQTLSFTYSYDFTISRLDYRNTHGSHEISLIYHFCLDWPRRKKPGRRSRKLPCPGFLKSTKYKSNYLGF